MTTTLACSAGHFLGGSLSSHPLFAPCLTGDKAMQMLWDNQEYVLWWGIFLSPNDLTHLSFLITQNKFNLLFHQQSLPYSVDSHSTENMALFIPKETWKIKVSLKFAYVWFAQRRQLCNCYLEKKGRAVRTQTNLEMSWWLTNKHFLSHHKSHNFIERNKQTLPFKIMKKWY